MSTKAIEKVVRGVGLASRDAATDEAVALALTELANIRRAASEWVAVDGQPGPGKMKRIDALLRAINEEAP